MDQVICLTLTLAGRAYRIASRACSPVSVDGPLHYRGGLPEIELEESMDVLAEGPAQELTLDLLLPSSAYSLLSYGHSLDGAPVRIDAWTPGTAWEQRRRLLRGEVAESQPAESGQPISLRVRTDPGDDLEEYPPAGAIVDEVSFGHYSGAFANWDEAFTGRGYPTIIGNPGVRAFPALGSTDYRGSPAYVVAAVAGQVWAMVAGHHVDDRRAPLVRLIHGPTGASEDLAIISPTLSVDGRGRRVAIVRAVGAVAAVWSAGDPLYARWIGASGLRGEAGPLTSAGDVLLWALRQSALPVDWARASSCAATLPWRLDGYWDDRVRPLEWIRDNLLPILPISLRSGPDGIYPVRWWWQGERSPIAHLEAGRNARLLERPRWEGLDQEVSEVRLGYAVGAQTSEPQATITVSASRPVGARQASGLLAHRCRPGSYSYTSGMVWSDMTAGVAARTILASRRRRLVVPLLADPSVRRELSDPVEVSLPPYQISRARGTIRAIRHTPSWSVLDVALDT